MTEDINPTKVENPFFSVVVPVYNKGPHVARAIDSILAQTFTNFELLIVCDPSTDNSNEEVAKFTDPRMRVFHRDEPGPGGYAARNLGIKNARADWVAFLDADDEWYPEHLQKMSEAVEAYPKANIFSAGWQVSFKGNLSENKFYQQNKKHSIQIDFQEYLRFHAYGSDIAHTDTVVVRHSSMMDIGMFPEVCATCKRAGDGKTWLHIMMNGGVMAWSPHIASVYHQDAEFMVTRSRHYYWDENCLINFMKGQVPLVGLEKRKLLKKYLKKRLLNSIFSSARVGQMRLRDLKLIIKYPEINKRLPFLLLAPFFPSIIKNILKRLLPEKKTA